MILANSVHYDLTVVSTDEVNCTFVRATDVRVIIYASVRLYRENCKNNVSFIDVVKLAYEIREI